MVTAGPVVPPGHLPVFSVADEQEARDLLVAACGTNLHGDFVARELVVEQTLENLARFSHRLADIHDYPREAGKCRCKE